MRKAANLGQINTDFSLEAKKSPYPLGCRVEWVTAPSHAEVSIFAKEGRARLEDALRANPALASKIERLIARMR